MDLQVGIVGLVISVRKMQSLPTLQMALLAIFAIMDTTALKALSSLSPVPLVLITTAKEQENLGIVSLVLLAIAVSNLLSFLRLISAMLELIVPMDK